jgi:hypothetical protein
MNDTVFGGVVQANCNLANDSDGFRDSEPPVLQEQSRQIATCVALKCDPMQPVYLAGFNSSNDARVLKPHRDSGLSAEPLNNCRNRRERRMQHLDDTLAASIIHDAENQSRRTSSQWLLNQKMPQPCLVALIPEQPAHLPQCKLTLGDK